TRGKSACPSHFGSTWGSVMERIRKTTYFGLTGIYLAVAFANFYVSFLPMAIIPFHVYMTTAIVLAWRPLDRYAPVSPGQAAYIDALLVVICIWLCVHYWVDSERMQLRMAYVDGVFTRDIIAFFAGTIVLLEAVRRVVGLPLLSVLLVCLAYAFFGQYLPSFLSFGGFTIPELTEILSMQPLGIFDVPAQVGLDIIVFFVVFGAVFSATGGGEVFIDIAFKLTGRMVGGAAKTAVVGSAMFGTISGSAVANVTTTGVLTIPLMRRGGLDADQAGATEAIASSGGQLMPPIMGTSAFVMAQFLGVPYANIALAGLIPAVGFYLALFLTIDLRARRANLARPVNRETPSLPPRIHLLLAPIALVVFLFLGYSARYAAVVGIAVALLVPLLRRTTRYSIRDLIGMIPSAGTQAAEVAVSCTSVGIVMAVAIQSSLVLKFVGFLAVLGGGSLYLSLLLVILGCIIMGMGMPTVAAYIVGAVLFVPAMQDFGVAPLSAHYFILYYCVLSMVTPPVALTAYAAAGVSGGNVMRTSVLAFVYGLVMFVIPFGFVNDTAILWQGAPGHVAIAALGMLVATAGWAIFLQGWLGRVMTWIERVPFAVGSFALILIPSNTLAWWAILIGLALIGAWCLLGGRRISRNGNGAT
ncbi:MAG: TRAP transporter permease, partial [Pseudorhodobacter sp.]